MSYICAVLAVQRQRAEAAAAAAIAVPTAQPASDSVAMARDGPTSTVEEAEQTMRLRPRVNTSAASPLGSAGPASPSVEGRGTVVVEEAASGQHAQSQRAEGTPEAPHAAAVVEHERALSEQFLTM
jgi:hypothetical protein